MTEALRAFNVAETTNDLVHALHNLTAAVEAGNVFASKEQLLDIATYKRTVAPELWSREVASAFGGLLIAVQAQPRLNDAVGYSSVSPYVAEVAHVESPWTSAAAGPPPSAPDFQEATGTALLAGAADSPADMEARIQHDGSAVLRADIARSKRKLFLFSVVLAAAIILSVVLSIATKRRFGAYFLTNILAAIVALWGVAITARRFRSLQSEVAAQELFFVVVYCCMNAGLVAAFAFLLQLAGRVDHWCDEKESRCLNHSPGAYKFAAYCAAISGMLVALWGVLHFLHVSNNFLSVVRLYLNLFDRTHSPPSSCSTRQQVLAANFLPSLSCFARCCRRRPGRRQFNCDLGNAPAHRDRNACIFLCCFLFGFPIVICGFFDNTATCYIQLFFQILCSMLSNHSCM